MKLEEIYFSGILKCSSNFFFKFQAINKYFSVSGSVRVPALDYGGTAPGGWEGGDGGGGEDGGQPPPQTTDATNTAKTETAKKSTRKLENNR